MKPDITNKADIKKVVAIFYEKLKADEELYFFFTKVIPVNWDRHIAMMSKFWENVLFYTGDYEGNPLETHRKINAKHATEPEHFKKWLQLFDETLDQNFKGENTEKIRQHARTIASVMENKM